MQMKMVEKIRLIARRKEITISDLAKLSGQSNQNLAGKLRRTDLRESDLVALADALGCDVEITFIDRKTGERY